MIDDWLADLRWLLLSPPLLSPDFPRFNQKIALFTESEKLQISAWLDALHNDAQLSMELTQWMANKPPKMIVRLGRYAEHLVEFFLRFGPTHRLTAANLQIKSAASSAGKNDHTTLGEIDFLLHQGQSQAGQPLHWELAVKYFVCRDIPNATVADLMGPDSAETFDHKIEKIMGKQLLQAPPAPFCDTAWQPQALTRGWMFYRFGGVKPRIAELSQNHDSGFWIEHRDINQLPASTWAILPRARWLSPATFSPAQVDQVAVTLDQLGQAVSNLWAGRPSSASWPSGVMTVSLLSETRADGSILWKEINRGFVMPDDWPHL
jgi:uncharacterized protein